MTQTSRLALPLLAAGQAQKHVTLNETLLTLDTLVQLAFSQGPLNTPPVVPDEGMRVLVGTAPTAEFAGKSNQIAEWLDGAWRYLVPQGGWLAVKVPECLCYLFDGSAWRILPLVNIDQLGIGATPSSDNRLAVASNASLFTHNGTSHRMAINKAAAAQTASVQFQDNYTSMAEIGLTGNDNFSVKVSPNGSSWKSALVVDRTSGWVGVGITAPNAPLDIAGPDNSYVIALRGGSQVLSYQTYGTNAYFWNYGGNMIMGTNAAYDLQIGTNATERMRFTAAGGIGVGKANPSVAFDVAGAMRVGQYAKASLPSATTSGAGAMLYVSDESGGAVLAFSDGSAWRRVTDRAVVT